MGVYTVLAPPVRDGAALPEPMEIVFVKEGFSWPALFFAGPWLIYRRMWLVLAAYIVLALGLAVITHPLGDNFPGGIIVLIHLFFALEANELRRWTLYQRGYRFVSVVQGHGLEEAEIRYFSEVEAADGVATATPVPPTPPSPPAPPMRPAAPARPSAEAGDVVGLFPAPGGGDVSVAIIDYGAGNLRSAEKAFQFAIAASGVRETVTITSEPEVVAKADRVVLPGDGAFADCKRNLDAIPGMIDAIDESIDARGRPFFGICVGMQLLATRGIEHHVTLGLDRIPGEVRPVEPSDPALKVPHMGWNTMRATSDHSLFDGIAFGDDGWHAYFLHGYHLVAERADDVAAVADYGGPVTAIVARGTIAGTQFHPEKSQKLGLKLIGNFLKWKP